MDKEYLLHALTKYKKSPTSIGFLEHFGFVEIAADERRLVFVGHLFGRDDRIRGRIGITPMSHPRQRAAGQWRQRHDRSVPPMPAQALSEATVEHDGY